MSIRKSASLVILSPQFEILFMKRPTSGSFASNHVFPGGRLESTDPSPQYAALRETYEETGLLIPFDSNTNPRIITDDDLSYEQALKKYLGFDNISRVNILSKSILSHISNWTTPTNGIGEPPLKRYQADFYLYKCPISAKTLGKLRSNSESVLLEWLTPQNAVNQLYQGKLSMMPPQFYILNSLIRYGTYQTIDNLCNRIFEPKIYKIYPESNRVCFDWGRNELGLVTFSEDGNQVRAVKILDKTTMRL